MAELSEINGGPLKPLLAGSMWSVLQRGIDINPDQTALVSPSQPAHHLQELVGPPASSASALGRFTPPPSVDYLSWTFTQLERAAVRLGSVLDVNGISPGASIVVILSGCAEWALMFWVAALKCCTLITLDTALLEPSHEVELQTLLDKLTPSLILVENQEVARAVDRLRTTQNKPGPFLGITIEPLTNIIPGWTSMLSMSFANDIKAKQATDSLDRTAMIIFTSGTSTGRPRGCIRRVGELLQLIMSISFPPLRSPLALINSGNFSATAASILYVCWHTGNAAVLAGGDFSAPTTLTAMDGWRPMVLTVVEPIKVDVLAYHSGYSQTKVSSVKHVQLIGGVTPIERLKRTQRVFPAAKIISKYGMTEAVGFIGWTGTTPKVEDIPTFQGVASSGVALPGIKLKVVDDESRVVRRNEPGVLHISGDMVTPGYLGGERAEDFYYEEDGSRWYITGDYTVIDDDGHVYVLGRYEHMIRNNGTVIAPATIENLLMKDVASTCYPSVTYLVVSRQVLVMGFKASAGKEVPYAIFDKDTRSPEDLQELVIKQLGSMYRLGARIMESLTKTLFPTFQAAMEAADTVVEAEGYALHIRTSKRDNAGQRKSALVRCIKAGPYENRKDKAAHISRRRLNTATQKTDCEFRLSLKENAYRALVIQKYRDDIIRKFNNNTRPTDIAGELRDLVHDDPRLAGITAQDVSNALARHRQEELAGRTPLQFLYDRLDKSDFFHRDSRDPQGRLTGLFLAPRATFHRWRQHHDVLVLDCTYKTNRFNMPLLNICAATRDNKTDRESKPPQDINVLLQAPYMPIRERTPEVNGPNRRQVNVLVIGLLVEGYRAAIESSSLSTPIPPLHSTTSTHFGIFRSIQALRAQALLGHHTSHKLSGLRAAPRAHSTSKSHGGQDQRGGIRHITRSLNGMSGLRLYDCLLLNGTGGDDGYGLRHIEENGDTYEAGTRMQRAYQAGRQTPVSDDDDQPVRRETQDCIFVAGLTDDAALEDVWDQLESQLDEADQARSALEEGGLL
ncbi:AMP-binding enzyme [Hirsutella rhossiliensis]|uniref:AMP-binding enzyme domain-containing protein n=1 Tax=Hirsutella rhossiliensis TaxID=111463 RepID=A0A9P8N611_9HYPO|nr:AMP-binding enzyme domain-containing protein [Hirsutella rhossiliensis]KAH0967575.1 AMP-binding enzyme domain-containing protein [Hirsutella rhossiliensis]